MANDGRGGNTGLYAAIIAVVGSIFGIVYAVGGGTAYMDYKTAATPSAPASGYVRLYSKTGNALYQQNSSGTEIALAGGTQNGTTGATTNALVKATAANTLGDSTLFNNAAGRLSLGGTSVAEPAMQALAGPIINFVDATNAARIEVDANVFRAQTDLVAGGRVWASDNMLIYEAASGQFNWFVSGVYDTGLSRAAAGVVTTTNGSSGLGWIQDSAGRDYATADQTVDSATLTADDTISITLKAGRKYKFTLVYYMTPGDTVADGLKFDMNGGSATMTGFEARVRVVDNVGQDVSVTNSRMTALNTAVSLTGNQPATSFTMYVDGFAEVNAAGTFIPEFAKSADAGTGVVKKKYSQIEVLDYP